MRHSAGQTVLQRVGAALGGGLLLLGLVAAAPARAATAQAAPRSLSSTAASGELVISSQVDKVRLTMAEPVTLSVTIAGPIKTTPKVTVSSFEGFHVVSTGQSQQMKIAGGAMSLAITLQYVLMPTAVGRHRLGPVLVEHEGRRYETSVIEVEVREAAGSRPTPMPPAPRRPVVRGGTVL